MRMAAVTMTAMTVQSGAARRRSRHRSRGNKCLPFGSGHRLIAGAAILSRHQPHRTAPTAALPINVSTTRRERFMVAILPRIVDVPSGAAGKRSGHSRHPGGQPRQTQAKAGRFHGIVQRIAQPPPEKCAAKACANEPKPPRCHAARTGIRKCPRTNGSRRNRRCRSCCATSRRQSRHGRRTKIRAAGIRRCLQQRGDAAFGGRSQLPLGISA